MADFSFLITNIYNELANYEKELKKSSTSFEDSRLRFNAACDIVLKFEKHFNYTDIPKDSS